MSILLYLAGARSGRFQAKGDGLPLTREVCDPDPARSRRNYIQNPPEGNNFLQRVRFRTGEARSHPVETLSRAVELLFHAEEVCFHLVEMLFHAVEVLFHSVEERFHRVVIQSDSVERRFYSVEMQSNAGLAHFHCGRLNHTAW